MARRSIRRPASRSCSHSGASHSKSFSPPQMSLTSTSRRPCSASMRATSASTCVGLEVVGRDGDPRAAGRVDELGGLLDRLGPVVLRALLARAAAGAVDGRARLAERDGDPAPGAAGRARHERHLPGQRTRHRAEDTTSSGGSGGKRPPCRRFPPDPDAERRTPAARPLQWHDERRPLRAAQDRDRASRRSPIAATAPKQAHEGAPEANAALRSRRARRARRAEAGRRHRHPHVARSRRPRRAARAPARRPREPHPGRLQHPLPRAAQPDRPARGADPRASTAPGCASARSKRSTGRRCSTSSRCCGRASPGCRAAPRPSPSAGPARARRPPRPAGSCAARDACPTRRRP